MYPFSDGDTFATFRNLQETVQREIRELDNEYVLKASPAELEQHFIQKGTIAPLVLHADDYHIESRDSVNVDVSHDFLRARRHDGRKIEVPGTRLKVAIPFEGSANLWRVRPSTFSVSGYPEIEIKPDRILLTFSFPDDSADAEALRKRIDGDIKSLVDAVGNLAADVSTHNTAIVKMVPLAVEAKRNKAMSATDAVASLGIPMKRTDKPPTYSIPTRRRPSPVSRPSVSTEKYEPEPELDAAEYDHILTIMRSMALVIERNPDSFQQMDEQGIRDHFLLQLNGHYEGGATGETFNASGKTDILIRAGDRNVFIAECKFWRGQGKFSGALDQLLGYLSWRDTKAAILVFNRTLDSSSVRAKMHATITERPEHRKTLAHEAHGDSRYVLVKESDPGREIILTTQLYDVPGDNRGSD